MLGPGAQQTTEEALRLDWIDQAPAELWRVPCGDSYSPPVVASNRVVLFHRIKDRETIDCLNALSGERLWRVEYPTDYTDRYGYSNGPRCAPIIHKGHVFALGSQAVLTCIRLNDGKTVWQRNLGKELRVPQGFFGTGATPTLHKDRLLINIGAPDGHGVIALDTTAGKTLWHTSDHEASYSMPIVGKVADETLALFFTRAGLLAVDPETGKERYEYPFRSRTHESVNAATPMIIDDSIFLSSCYKVGAVSLGVKNGQLIEQWKGVEIMQNHWATSLYHDGHVYGFHGRHGPNCVLRCVDYKTGSVLWDSPTGLGRSTAVRVGKHLIVLGERGDLALVELSPERYIEKARHRVLNFPSWAPPAISNGRLFLRSNRTLLCLDLRPE